MRDWVTGLRFHGLGALSPAFPTRSVAFALGEGREPQQRHERVVGAWPREVAGQQPHQPLQPAHQRRVPVHLHAEVFDHRHALRARDALGDPAQQRLVDAAAARVVGHRDRPQRRLDRIEARRVLSEPVTREKVLLHENRGERGEAPRVGAGAHREMDVRHGSGLAAARIDDDQRARRIVPDRREQRARAREAVRLPRVLADEDRDLAVLEVAVDAAAHHLALHPGFAGLLLRERVGAVLHSERLQRAVGVRATEVVALAAAAVKEDRLAAVARADVRELCGDLAQGGRPVDTLVAAVRAPAQRRIDAVRAILVVVHALRLLADVALRHRVRLVAAHARDARSARLHFEAAVDGAQDAGGLLPVACVGFGRHCASAWFLSFG